MAAHTSCDLPPRHTALTPRFPLILFPLVSSGTASRRCDWAGLTLDTAILLALRQIDCLRGDWAGTGRATVLKGYARASLLVAHGNQADAYRCAGERHAAAWPATRSC